MSVALEQKLRGKSAGIGASEPADMGLRLIGAFCAGLIPEGWALLLTTRSSDCLPGIATSKHIRSEGIVGLVGDGWPISAAELHRLSAVRS